MKSYPTSLFSTPSQVTTLIGIAAFSLFSLHSNAFAQGVILSENFDSIPDSASLNDNGWYSVNPNINGGTWSIQTPATPPAPFAGNALRSGSGSTKNTYMVKQWETQTLNSVGSSLSLSFDYYGNHTTAGLQFSLALFHTSKIFTDGDLYDYGEGSTKELIATASNTDPISDAVGYGFAREDSLDPEADMVAWLFSETAGGAASVGEFADSLLDMTDVPYLFDNAAHAINFSVTKVMEGARIDFVVDGTLIASVVDTSATGDLTFNSLKLNGDLNGYYDNINIVSTVPEPATSALLFGVGVLAVRIIRRKRTVA